MRAGDSRTNISDPIVLGVDIGTQSLKVVVLDKSLHILASSSVTYGVDFPQPGWAEQDPKLWEQALPEALRAALANAEKIPDQVAAIGIGGQLDGCVAINSRLEPISPCLIWMDRRATSQVERVDPVLVRKTSGIVADAGHMAAKIAWLKENSASKNSITTFHQPVSYLVAQLTGQHVMDHSLASTSMLYSLEKKGWDATLLDAFGVSTRELPSIAQASAVAGRITAEASRWTGLREGTPVAVGTGDDFSSVVGAGVYDTHQLVSILGTAEVTGILHPKIVIDSTALVETHPFALGSLSFIENPGWLAGGAITWLSEILGVQDAQDFDELAAKANPGCDGLTFLPCLSGAMTPEWNAQARGCFYGLTPLHGRAEMARAVLESCAFAMKDIVERLRSLGAPAHSVLLSGGGAKSALWAQIRADVVGLPVFVAEHKDTSAIGSAVLAALAGGLESSYESCAKKIYQISSKFEPNADREKYKRAYQRYQQLFQSLKPIFSSS